MTYDLSISKKGTDTFFLILEDRSLFVGPLPPLFKISRDISPRFKSKDGSLTCVFCHLCAMDSSDSPLVGHLLAFGHQTFFNLSVAMRSQTIAIIDSGGTCYATSIGRGSFASFHKGSIMVPNT